MDYFKVPQPCCISFSGGRTSAYMLRRILDAFGGTLPADVVVCFANTGKEREETLQFVKDCGEQWDVEIVWLEHCFVDGERSYKRVSFETASRKGEPFEELIRAKKYLPNPVVRYCTADLKIRTINRYLREGLGWDEYTTAVGIRADEPRRLAKLAKSEHGEKIAPLGSAGITEQEVLAYWRSQSFDLQLKSYEGNCDLCFLKGAGKLLRIIGENPSCADWWIATETVVPSKSCADWWIATETVVPSKGGHTNATFRSDRPSYAKLAGFAHNQLRLPLIENEEDNLPCDCTD